MKARVKATGEIVEVYHYGKPYYVEYIGEKPGRIFYPEELDLFDDPDYWTRLEHQAAIAAMQGMLNNSLLITDLLKVNKSHEDIVAEVTGTAIRYAHALVEKMKNKEEK